MTNHAPSPTPVLVLREYGGADEYARWNGLTLLGPLTGPDALEALAGEEVRPDPEPGCSDAPAAVAERARLTRAENFATLRAAIRLSDNPEAHAALDRVEARIRELEETEADFGLADPCSLKWNTHRRYEVMVGEQVVATWYPVAHREARPREATRGVTLECHGHGDDYCSCKIAPSATLKALHLLSASELTELARHDQEDDWLERLDQAATTYENSERAPTPVRLKATRPPASTHDRRCRCATCLSARFGVIV